MAYPLIILGAGASFDALDESQYHELSSTGSELERFRPPVTNSIFELRRFSDFIDKHPDIPALARFVNSSVPGRMSFEQVLSEIETKKVVNNEDRYKWLVALRFYLVELFGAISQKYHRSVNNYGYLVDQIYDYCGGKALVVNFNYDLLFEKNIKEIIEAKDMNAYINGSLKVVKIHGSCNWSYFAQSIIDTEDTADAYSYFVGNAKGVAMQQLQNTQYIINPPNWNFRHRINRPFDTNLYLPAVAIPASNKKNIFVCPDAHIKVVEDNLPLIDRILIVGWKAGDPFLLEMINQKINKSIPTWIVNKNANDKEIRMRYAQIPNLNISGIFTDGFNSFVRAGRVIDFLSF